MQITRLHLEHFGRHSLYDVEFAPGLNVVRGVNEAGKSTIQRAIEMALFRRATSVSDDLERIRSWADGDADPVVELQFNDDEGNGVLRKAFAGQRGTVELRIGSGAAQQVFNDPAAVEQQVARLTGLPSEKFFRATASVHHHELTGLTQDESTLRDRLQQSMSGADRGTHAARKKLEEAVRRYKTEGPKNPGYLKVMRAEVDRLREAVRQGESALVALERDRTSLAQAMQLRAELEARLAEQQRGAQKAERATLLATKAADAAHRYALYRRATELRDELGKLDASHPSKIALATLRSTVEQLRNIEFKLSEMRAELAAEPDLSGYDAATPSPRWRPWVIAGTFLLVLAATVGVAGFALRLGPLGIVVAAIVALLGGLSYLMASRERRHLNDIRLQNELRESEIARRLAGRTEIAEKVRQAEQERAHALASLGVRDLATAESTLTAETDIASQTAMRNAEYRGLLGDQPTGEDVALLRDQAAAEVDECRHALAGIGEVGNDPEKQLSAYRVEIQRLTPQREAALQAEAQADARVSANGVDAEQVASDSEALQAAVETLAAAERRLRIYEDVLTTLNRSEQGTMKKAARYLEQRMARDIERITGGRYRRLKVDEQTLTFTVYSPELSAWTDVRRLSQGTLDQLYLCARLGIIRQVTSPASPPILFDDPFVTFDDERAKRTLSLLKEIAREHQLIFLTTTDRYDKQADRVVVLPAPDQRDEPEPLAVPAGPVETISMWSSTVLPPARPRPVVPAGGNGSGHGVPAAPADPAQPGVTSTGPVEHAPLWPEER